MLTALGDLAVALTPSPVRGLRAARDRLNDNFSGWDRIALDPPADLDPWAGRHLDRLLALAARARSALTGDTLVHTDLRADNLLLTPEGRVMVVDWPHACLGPAWLDTVLLLINVRLFGGHDAAVGRACGRLNSHPPAPVRLAAVATSGVIRRWIPQWARRTGLVLFTALIVEYFVLPQLAGARAAAHLLARVTPGFLVAGLAVELASLVSYSALTRSLMPPGSRPSLWTVLRIDLAGLGVSHVVPGGGATATALRYRLFTVAGMARTDVITATAIQGVGTAVVLAGVFTAGLVVAFPSTRHNPFFLVAATAAAVLLAVGAGAAVLLTRHQEQMIRRIRVAAVRLPRLNPDRIERVLKNLGGRLDALIQDPRLLRSTLTWASANWLFDAASLWVFIRAFGHTEGLQGLLVGYGLAGILALLPLTPGGLGIVEGTLVSVLVGFGTPHPNAVLGVITWRLAEFWLPIPLGAATYLSLRTGILRPDRLLPRSGPARIGAAGSARGVGRPRGAGSASEEAPEVKEAVLESE